MIGSNVAEFDAGAGGNPFVGSVHFFGQIVIADTVCGQIAAGTEDFGILHDHRLLVIYF